VQNLFMIHYKVYTALARQCPTFTVGMDLVASP